MVSVGHKFHHLWCYVLPVGHLVIHVVVHHSWVISSLPMRMCIIFENVHHSWLISSSSVRSCITLESYHHYPWGISSLPLKMRITHKLYLLCLWGCALPSNCIIITREAYHHYHWRCALKVIIIHNLTWAGSISHFRHFIKPSNVSNWSVKLFTSFKQMNISNFALSSVTFTIDYLFTNNPCFHKTKKKNPTKIDCI